MTLPVVRQVVGELLRPARFFVAGGAGLSIDGPAEETWRFELLGGHLLAENMTRRRETFLAWHVSIRRPDDPHVADVHPPTPHGDRVVSVLAAEDCLHVVRHVLVYGHEAHEESPGVIVTRPARILSREFVGTAKLSRDENVVDAAGLKCELEELLRQAFTGASRLPITSVESPHPLFALGMAGWLSDARPEGDGPSRSAEELVGLCAEVVSGERARAASLLELALRAAPPDRAPLLADRLVEKARATAIIPLVKTLFHQLALTPYTGLGRRIVAFLDRLSRDNALGVEPVVDLVGYMLRQIGRHLTAFDLWTFHSFGADYPDLLLLDELLTWYLSQVESRPDLFLSSDGAVQRKLRLRRRALRQAWYFRRQYEGLAVPDVPTSPGDNQRVLPDAFPHLSDEEITQPAKRSKRLFAGRPLVVAPESAAHRVLRQSLRDLEEDDELRELGLALYLDRPLGCAKPPGHRDRTPLLSYEAVSRTIAAERLRDLRRLEMLSQAELDGHRERLAKLAVAGFALEPLPPRPRLGVVCLEDAFRLAADFVFLRTTRRSLDGLLSLYDLAELHARCPDVAAWLASGRDVLLIRTSPVAPGGPVELSAFDGAMQPRLSLTVPARHPETDYVEWRGREYVRDGMQAGPIGPDGTRVCWLTVKFNVEHKITRLAEPQSSDPDSGA
ncbi:MAG: hypothetical protein HYS13_05965 [Planctomycetia bacterium]|nr:hypothetical protein [Planctomycetia bacterium]